VSAQEVIPAAEVHAAERRRISLVAKMAGKYGLEPEKMMATLKATAFKGDVTNEQMAALLIVADQHNLNPWLREIYAFPSRRGSCRSSVWTVGPKSRTTIRSSTAWSSRRTTRNVLARSTARTARTPLLSPSTSRNAARYRSVEEATRSGCCDTKPSHSAPASPFRSAGIFDPDEAERVLAAEDAIDVTPEDEPILRKGPVNWADRAPRISPKRMRKIVDTLNAHADKSEGAPILEIIRGLHPEEYEQVWKVLRSWERTAIKKALGQKDADDDAAALVIPADDDLLPWSKGLLASCVDAAALTAAWGAIEAAYDANGAKLPPDELVTLCDERRTALTVQ
jgi:hypothetical protein